MLFIESILYEGGAYHNLELHQKRLNRTLKAFMSKPKTTHLQRILPDLKLDGKYKVRVVYTIANQCEAGYDIEYSEYVPKKIKTLEIINSKNFDYSFKYEDRSHINTLVKKSRADDIIIAINNQLTDSSYSNIVFWDGSHWITPSTPLLEGVRRQQLLSQGKIKEASISTSDLNTFEKVSLINAMLDLEEVEIPIIQVSKQVSI